jgi:hypothetical protein
MPRPQGAAANDMPDSEPKLPLERSTLEAYGGAILGVLGAVVTAWWAKSILLVCAAGLLIHAVSRSSWTIRWSWRSKIATGFGVLVVLSLVGGAPIFEDFHKQHPRITFNWPITFNGPLSRPVDPPDMPPLNLPGPPLSKWGKMMYLCPYPPEVNASDPEAAKAQIRRNADIFGRALGLDLILNEIQYGIRFDATANSAEGQMRMGMSQRFTAQMEAASRGIFIVLTTELPGAISILGQVPADRDSDFAKAFDKAIELFGFAPGTCRMF